VILMIITTPILLGHISGALEVNGSVRAK